MPHPLENFPARTRLFLFMLFLTVLISIVMGIMGRPLNTLVAPNGIVSFEFSGSTERAQAILNSWDMNARTHAAFIQGLDFLYLCIYSTTIGLACLLSGGVLRSRRWPFGSLASPLAWGLWLAASFDTIENIALVILLTSPVQSPWPQIAWVSAVIKFGLLFLGLTYAFYGLAVRLVPPRSNRAVYR